MGYIFRLNKETFKFSCTHFTIFGPETGEKMHGHNYQVGFDLHFNDINRADGLAVDFNLVKPLIKTVCDELDEHILIAQNSPFQKVTTQKETYTILFNKKTYTLPHEDVLLLPLVNISSEELARYLCTRFLAVVPAGIGLKKVETTVEETRGQAVTYFQNL
jgi:6-pyruvoyltetrahydropterin/6-carboxytetrahydropterin synthase